LWACAKQGTSETLLAARLAERSRTMRYETRQTENVLKGEGVTPQREGPRRRFQIMRLEERIAPRHTIDHINWNAFYKHLGRIGDGL